ncbi:MAG: hypothetical protein ABIK61_02410 [candidate division WOR-3 bacterium]
MFGYGRRQFGWRRTPVAPRGYIYIGPCRCGTGPHAFYQDAQGRFIPAHHLHWQCPSYQPTKEDLKAELEALKHEKAELEKLIAELEEQTKE